MYEKIQFGITLEDDVRTEFMVVDVDGRILEPLTPINFPMELPFADDIIVKSGKVVAYAGPLRIFPHLDFTTSTSYRYLIVYSYYVMLYYLLHSNIDTIF